MPTRWRIPRMPRNAEYTWDLWGIRSGFEGCWERGGMSSFPVLVRSVSPSGETRYVLGDPILDRYLEFVGGRDGGRVRLRYDLWYRRSVLVDARQARPTLDDRW